MRQGVEIGLACKDEVTLPAAFQLLADFVEQERPDKHIDWSHDAVYRRAWKEIRNLYQWWTKTRPSRRSPLDDKKISQPPLGFEKLPGTNLSRLVTPDKKRYAAYYRALSSLRTEMARRGSAKPSSSHKYPRIPVDMKNGMGTKRRSPLLVA